MERRLRTTSFLQDHEDPDEPSSENGPDCSSGDDSKLPAEPSPKKRRCMQKRVVSIPIGDMEGSRSRGEVFPPSDSWTWRKYGQKPIKGSPYPRGYYRCSSAKGCPARKQVERSHLDPTMLLITYASDHNHPRPLPLPLPHPHRPGPPPSPKPHEDSTPSSEPLDLELADDPLLGNSDEFGWLGDVAVTAQVFDRPIYDSGDLAAVRLDLGEDEESLFADLGELPECSFVFRPGKWRFSTAVPCCGVPYCGSTR